MIFTMHKLMTKEHRKHRIAILALDGFVPYDLSIPFTMFSLATLQDGSHPYEVLFTGPGETAVSGPCSVTGNHPLCELQKVDTIIVPGLENALEFSDQAVLNALRIACAGGVRLASICTGACVLAAAGLLDGLRATTHWDVASDLAALYPSIEVEPDVVFVDNGHILTSAGLAAGTDLCLHLMRKDFGAAVAEQSAKFFVVPIEREGNQIQFIRYMAPQMDGSVSALLLWLLDNLHLEHTLQSIAQRVGISARTLNRRFKEQVGITPMAWLTRTRIRRAQALLESTTLSVEQIVSTTGFASATAFREHFRHAVGVSPAAWRKTYGMGKKRKGG